MSKKKILLVDDSITALMIGQVVLTRAAYSVVLARNPINGPELLGKLRDQLGE